VSRFEEAFEIVRRLVAGERVTLQGRFHDVEDAVLLPSPTRPVPLMIGANAPRMLSIALPHVASWNTWYTHYGNTPEGFSRHNAEVSEAAERAGRDPATLERSACVLVSVGGSDERPETASPVEAERLADHLRKLEEAGADEAILVASPITQESVRALATVL
jgi:alkanesulfonate monooxygenase SsuD/methylene tetrahydromethanopterin reductase-like flavin-dependent oxidoreductase (luciferase family)